MAPRGSVRQYLNPMATSPSEIGYDRRKPDDHKLGKSVRKQRAADIDVFYFAFGSSPGRLTSDDGDSFVVVQLPCFTTNKARGYDRRTLPSGDFMPITRYFLQRQHWR